jgi:tetratricopeptide (TPR) repeat protein
MESFRPERGSAGGTAVSGAKKPVISDFDLIRMIGQGSYGDVWLARGLTGVYRAVKIVWRDRFADAEPFEREFEGLKSFTTMSLPESSQLALLHVGRNEADRYFYYVMELADDVETGREVDPAKYRPLTLKEVRARQNGLPADECVAIGFELARALAGLHSRALVHRDIKPSNVIMVGGMPKLADIGLVASTGDARTFVGTAGYVPPEGPGKPNADVFALGKLLYELVTGLDREDYPRLPSELFKRPDRKALFELNEIILRSCDSDERRRYPDASAVLADLLVLKQGQSLRLKLHRARNWRLAAGLVLILAAAGAGYHWWGLSPAPAPEASVSEAKHLVAKAWEQMSKLEVGPEELEVAEGLCKRASELDPTDADVWAAWSTANLLYFANGNYENAARREAARSDAARALELAPDSYESRLAQACYLVRFFYSAGDKISTAKFAKEADQMLRRLLRERPSEPRALRAFGTLQHHLGHLNQARTAMTILARNPKYAAAAWLEVAQLASEMDDSPGFDAALDRSIAIQPYPGNIAMKLSELVEWQGDLDSAEALLQKIPGPILQSETMLGAVFEVYYVRREPDKALSFLRRTPREWFGSGDGPVPIRYYIGIAQDMAGRKDIARVEWQQALKLVEQRLSENPTSRHAIALRSRLLVLLGEFAEAEKSLHLGEEAGGWKDWFGIFTLKMAQGRQDEAVDIFLSHLSKDFFPNAAQLRLDPRFDPLRSNPRFKAELAKAEADPDRSPTAPPRQEPGPPMHQKP